MKTEPFDIEKAKAGRKVVTRRGDNVEIKMFDGRGGDPINGYVGDEVFLRTWYISGYYLDEGQENIFDLLLVSLEFPEPPQGHQWHNPLGLTPEQVGEDYRLALVGELLPPHEYKIPDDDWRKYPVGDGVANGEGWRSCTIRLPKGAPFNIPAPAGPTNGLNHLSKFIHESNKKWWTDLETGEPIERNKGELLCLIHSEISEAMEGARRNLTDDHLPLRKMEEVELADALIRILDYSAGFGYDIEGAVKEKLAYNATREDHRPENRKLAHGKKF